MIRQTPPALSREYTKPSFSISAHKSCRLKEPERGLPELPAPAESYSAHPASGSFTPYTDDPDGDGQGSNEMLMQAHRQIMDGKYAILL